MPNPTATERSAAKHKYRISPEQAFDRMKLRKLSVFVIRCACWLIRCATFAEKN
jgi:hypothetical protein